MELIPIGGQNEAIFRMDIVGQKNQTYELTIDQIKGFVVSSQYSYPPCLPGNEA